MDELREPSRQEQIHSKGFSLTNRPVEYGKIKVGVKTLDDAVLTLGQLNDRTKGISKPMVLKALMERDIPVLQRISEYFYQVSGIYQEVCNYAAFLYRYDWYIVPEVLDEQVKNEKIIKDYIKILHYLDASYIKKLCGEIALKVIQYGCYYGYVVPNEDRIIIQELPIQFCRTRYSFKGIPAIEFNMKYFDEKFPDINYRMRVLKMFPDEFAKGYSLFKQGKLKQDYRGDDGGWYLLDPDCAFKFNVNGSDIPMFANAIPSILDLDAAQDLDRRKQMQQLLKIIVQKLPIDKNGDLIFDVDEAADIHNNAVQMLRRAVGVDVLTTFADIESINTQDKNTTATQDDLAKMERQVYNALGVSKNLFNTDGNMALEKSILADESSLRNLLLQFDVFFDRLVEKKNTNKKKYNFSFYMIETTQYNYKDLSKMYKEQVQNGYSKMLPQIALGHPQSFVINSAYFENEVLKMQEVMIPPLLNSTLNGEDILGGKNQSSTGNSQNTTEDNKGGRPEKADDEKSEKTIQNIESKS